MSKSNIVMYFNKLINNFSLKSKFVTDVVWSGAATLVVGGSALLLQTLIGVYYNSEGIGLYSQVLAYYLILTSLGNFGFEISILKHAAEFSKDENKLKDLYTSAQLLTIITALIVVLVAYLIIDYYPGVFSSEEVGNGLLYCLPGVFFFSVNKNSNIFNSGLRYIKSFSLVKVFRWISIASIVFYVLFTKTEFNYIFLAFSFVEFVLFCYFILAHWKYIFKITDYSWLKIHFKYGYTNVLSSMISVLSSNLLILISGYYLSKAETGVVSFIVTFTVIFSVISSSIQINFNPIFAKKWALNDLKGITENLKKIFKYNLLIFSPLLLFTFGLYYGYTSLFMPIDFLTTFQLFVVMALGACLNFTFCWPATMLNMAGEVHKNLLRIGLTFVCNIMVSFMCIKFYGINGVAISSLINSISAITITYLVIKKSLSINLTSIIYNSFKQNV